MWVGLKSKGKRTIAMCSVSYVPGLLFFFALILALSLSTMAYAEENDDVMGDGLGKPFGTVFQRSWEESVISIPAQPKADSLLPFKVFETPTYKYYLDSSSLNVSGGDNVVRYTVVVETPSGIKNVFYEGIRCDTQEYKMYASALWGEDLSPITEPEWAAVKETGTGVYRYDLFKYYLCHYSIIRGSKKHILQLIEYPPDNFIEEELD
jgi:hypothetical protein